MAPASLTPAPTWLACATALPAQLAVLRLSGPDACAIARAAGLPSDRPWRLAVDAWPLAGGCCPVRTLTAIAPRSYTGCDLVEIHLPGSPDLVELALARLVAVGATLAPPGAFTRQALANGRLSLDQAEAVLALTSAGDERAARLALDRLSGELGTEATRVREELLTLRALVEAGLDFAEEDGVSAFDRAELGTRLTALAARLARWITAADAIGTTPVVCLVGPANAGKSALFARLTGATALVSPVPGTTRDWLEASWTVAGRSVRLIDTAGWLDRAERAAADANALDHAAIAAGRSSTAGAALILACSAPDAPLPPDAVLPQGAFVVATKSDLGHADARAICTVSATTGAGLDRLAALATEHLGDCASGEPRQQRLLIACRDLLQRLGDHLPGDELLADDLRRAAALLGDLIGKATPDDVLDAIFARFCIGK